MATIENIMEQLFTIMEESEILTLLLPIWITIACYTIAQKLFSSDSSSSVMYEPTFIPNIEIESKEQIEPVVETRKKTEPAPVKITDIDISSFWHCPYCDGANKMEEVSCVHCGAVRRAE